MTNVCIIATIVIYLVGMLLVGFVYSKSNEDSTDFTGGRKMGPLHTAGERWKPAICPAGCRWACPALPTPPALRRRLDGHRSGRVPAQLAHRGPAAAAPSATPGRHHVPQFLSLRFHDQQLVNALGAVIIIVFSLSRTRLPALRPAGKLFHSLFGVDYMIAMIVRTGHQHHSGRLRARTTTDLIQSVVMSIALVAVLAYGTVWPGLGCRDGKRPQPFRLSTMAASHDAAAGTAASYSLLWSTMAWGLATLVPHILLRFMAIEDEKKLVLSRRIVCGWSLPDGLHRHRRGGPGCMTKAGALEFLSGSSSETLIKVH